MHIATRAVNKILHIKGYKFVENTHVAKAAKLGLSLLCWHNFENNRLLQIWQE